MNSDTIVLLSDDQLITRAINASFDELGPVEAGRFLALARTKPLDPVGWHRQWQATLDRERYFAEVFDSTDEHK